jgi:hypothetical protein
MTHFRTSAAGDNPSERNGRQVRRLQGEVSIMTRYRPESGVPLDSPTHHPSHGGPDSGGQSGDTQGVSQTVDAAEESVEELAAAGQDYEAQILIGVEDATDHPGKPVPDRDSGRRRAGGAPDRRPA